MCLRPAGLHRPYIFILSLCAFFLLSICFVAPAYASSDPITITSQADTVNFPKSIDFTMSAVDSSSAITEADLFFMYNSEGYDAPHLASITPNSDGSVTAQWHQDTSSSSNFEPSGTQVTYYWQIQDKAGHVHADTAQTFTTEDTRFNWQALSQGLLHVHWYDRSADFGQIMLTQAATSVTRISGVLGSGPLRPLNLWVYKAEEDFHGSLPPNSYEWVGGIAFPSLSTAEIVVTSPSDDTLVRDMPHELTHLIFHQLTAKGILAPTWFDEGLAVYNQEYHEPDMQQRLDQALHSHTLIRLDDIARGFPASSDKAYLAYAQSWNLVGYMYSTFGKARVGVFITLMNNPQNVFAEDLRQALGVDQVHLENQWHLYLKQPPVLTPDQLTPTVPPTTQPTPTPLRTQVASDNTDTILLLAGSLLVLAPLMGVIIFIMRQRRLREKAMAVQAAQQYMNMTAGPPARFDAAAPSTDPFIYIPPEQRAVWQEYLNKPPNKQVSQD